MEVTNTVALIGSLADLAVQGIKLAKGGFGFGSMGAIMQMAQEVAALVPEAKAALPEVHNLNPAEAQALAQAALQAVEKIVASV